MFLLRLTDFYIKDRSINDVMHDLCKKYEHLLGFK